MYFSLLKVFKCTEKYGAKHEPNVKIHTLSTENC